MMTKLEDLKDVENFRKKLLYRSKNRGCKESDIILGQFAAKNINALSKNQLVKFDEILDLQDNDLVNWFMGREKLPEKYNSEIMRQIISSILQ